MTQKAPRSFHVSSPCITMVLPKNLMLCSQWMPWANAILSYRRLITANIASCPCDYTSELLMSGQASCHHCAFSILHGPRKRNTPWNNENVRLFGIRISNFGLIFKEFEFIFGGMILGVFEFRIKFDKIFVSFCWCPCREHILQKKHDSGLNMSCGDAFWPPQTLLRP